MTDRQDAAVRIIAIRQPFAVFESRQWQPPMNIYEAEQGIQMVAEIAGVDLNNLHVHVHPSMLQIHGSRQIAVPPGLRRIQRMEIASGAFQIDVALARPTDPERVEARYTDGLLSIWLPFAPQATQRVVVIQLGTGGSR